MAKSKKKESVNSELKKLKLPYLNIPLTKIDGVFILDNFKALLNQCFNSKYLEYNTGSKKIEQNTGKFTKITGYIPILYWPCLKYYNFNDPGKELITLGSYLSQLTQWVRYVFDMPKHEAMLEMVIDSIDQPDPSIKLDYFRYKKLSRLKMFNEITVDFFLS